MLAITYIEGEPHYMALQIDVIKLFRAGAFEFLKEGLELNNPRPGQKYRSKESF